MNREIYLIEKEGFKKADAVVAVSDYTRRVIIDHYGADAAKVRVVPNAIDHKAHEGKFEPHYFKKNGKRVVLFVGRLTYQKGPDYFLKAAKRVLELDQNVFFIFSGSGDMERWLIEEAARLGISDKVFFAGFLRGSDLSRIYQMADAYVMSSVSEPFGLTSLEAMANGTPVLVSRTSGASEMISHCLKFDFWDIEQMAAKILAVVKYPELRNTLSENGESEVKKFSWLDSAQKCLNIYHQVMTA
jgi:glycosyltransferase involved in cell wall biosynthesis